MPKVSVVIPTHNRPELLKRALDSVYTQTYTDFEVIVVDDGNNPRAEGIVREYTQRTNFVYLETGKNKGGSVARNIGIRKARGEYIAFLDDDDEWEKIRLEKIIGAFLKAPSETSIAFTASRAVDAKGKELYRRLPEHEGVHNFHQSLLRKCFIWTSALVIKRSYTDRGYIFDEKLTKNQEWDLELRLAKISPFVSIKEPLTILHIGESEQMGSISNLPNIIAGYEMFLKKHEVDYKANPHAYALRLFHVGHLYLQKGEPTQARKLWMHAWLLHKANFVYIAHWTVSHWPWLYRQMRSPRV